MLNKEIKDTLILFIGSIAVALFTLGFTFLMIRLLVDKEFPFAEAGPITATILLMAGAFYLGISLFSREKNERSFEYLFSLKYSRNKILLFKLAPRLAALLAYLLIYFILSQTITPFPVPGGWGFALLLYFSLFLSAESLSLLHKNHLANLVYALAIYMATYGISVLIILQIRFFTTDTFSVIRIMMAAIFVISILNFIFFWHHFSRADLENVHNRSFRSLLSVMKVSGTPVLILIIIWVVINRFDAPKIKTGFAPEGNRMTAKIDKKNGCYRLWTLSEAPGTDVESVRTLEKYRRLFDTNLLADKSFQAWNHQSSRSNYRPFLQKRIHILGSHSNDLDILIHPEKDLVGEILRAREPILRLAREYGILLSRYRKMISCPTFEDITRPGFLKPLPNLLTWLHVSKLYDWVSVLKASEGDWEHAVDRLIGHISFQKMVLGNTRLLLVNLICKGNMQYSIYTLAGLMNRKGCPDSACQKVLNQLPPCSIQTLGTRKALEGDYLGWARFIDEKEYLEGKNGILKWLSVLFFQNNRTKGYFYHPYREIIDLESRPPIQWKNGIENFEKKYRNIKKKNFWWVQNPMGKSITGYMATPNLTHVIHRTALLKSLMDMLRISAELHIKYDPEKTVAENLKALDSYKILDPCSGKPYRWSVKNQVLYSLGVDRDDDGGQYRYNTIMDTDYILPVTLYPLSSR